jgi:hypothetical protein
MLKLLGDHILDLSPGDLALQYMLSLGLIALEQDIGEPLYAILHVIELLLKPHEVHPPDIVGLIGEVIERLELIFN